MVAAELLGAIFSVVSSGSAIQGLDARDFGLGDGFALEDLERVQHLRAWINPLSSVFNA